MNVTLIIVSALLVILVLALSAVAFLAVHSLASVKDREMMGKIIKSMSDRILAREDEQIERMKMEKEVELGTEYMTTQKQIAALRRNNSNNGTIQRSAPDVHVSMDEEERV